MESIEMVHECLNIMISLKSMQDFSSVHGYTMTDLFYQQLVEFSIFHQLFSYCFNFLTFLSPLTEHVLGDFKLNFNTTLFQEKAVLLF